MAGRSTSESLSETKKIRNNFLYSTDSGFQVPIDRSVDYRTQTPSCFTQDYSMTSPNRCSLDLPN